MAEDGCDKIATRFESRPDSWHDFVWCDEHAARRTTEALEPT